MHIQWQVSLIMGLICSGGLLLLLGTLWVLVRYGVPALVHMLFGVDIDSDA